MRLLLGLDAPARGSALIDGAPYAALRWPLRSVGAVLEARAFHPGRTARAHLLALAAASALPRRRVEEVLAQVGLADAAGRRPAGSRWGWRSGSASRRRCSATRVCCCSTSRSTGSTRRGCAGSGT